MAGCVGRSRDRVERLAYRLVNLPVSATVRTQQQTAHKRSEM